MRQVLFEIPFQDWFGRGWNVPIYGFGAMLFLAFVVCTFLAVRLCRREGIAPERIQDLAVWVFAFGIIGARAWFILRSWYDSNSPVSLKNFFSIWDGGLVFYGSFIGGTIGFFVAYFVFLRKYRISNWKLMDVIAPCAAVGLCLGRVGCLLNGCCYGNVACTHCPEIHFPLSAPPRADFVHRGVQTAAGFTLKGVVAQPEVGQVEPQSPAHEAGLRAGDIILKANGREVGSFDDLNSVFGKEWPRGQNDLSLTVRHAKVNADGVFQGYTDAEDLAPFPHGTLGLHPTQLYESISMGFLVLVLLAYYPLKKHDGSVFLLFMAAYAVHRFLNEMLRTDTEKVALDMTESQLFSIIVLLAAGVLFFVIRSRKPASLTPSGGPPPATPLPPTPGIPQPTASA